MIRAASVPALLAVLAAGCAGERVE
ncbi:MAG: hypothetical protein RLZZ246_1342, partial [Planctomycetota bacterium]